MKHKEFDIDYNKLYKKAYKRLTLSAGHKLEDLNKLAIVLNNMDKQKKTPTYIKPIYAIGTTVTYQVGNGYKMGKIIKAFTFKGKWRYVFEGRKDKICEVDIKDIIILNNQELMEKL